MQAGHARPAPCARACRAAGGTARGMLLTRNGQSSSAGRFARIWSGQLRARSPVVQRWTRSLNVATQGSGTGRVRCASQAVSKTSSGHVADQVGSARGDGTREALARHYIEETALPASEISFLLGFDQPNSFYRAFRTWTGGTYGRACEFRRARGSSRSDVGSVWVTRSA